ncbi:hypothetical protein NQZ68_008366 [Dissostichus eleginoides]|nr:hypothetical protein NQZ68_008366 [Dissostichus eleginoides]
MRHLDDQLEQRSSVQFTKGTPHDREYNSSDQLLRPEEAKSLKELLPLGALRERAVATLTFSVFDWQQ